MQSSTSLAQELSKCCNELILVHGQALGAIEQLKSQVEDRYQESVTHADRQYAMDYQRLIAKNKRLVAVAKKQVIESTEKLLAQEEEERLRVAEYLQLGEVYQSNKGVASAPLIVPLIGHGNICLDFKDAAVGIDSSGYLRSIISRAIERTAPMQIRVVSCDPLMRNLEAPLVAIEDHNSSMIQYCQTRSSIDNLLDELTAQINSVSNKRLDGFSTIVQYHQSIGATVEPYMLIVMHDYPCAITREQHKRIRLLLKNCCPAGICFLMEVTSAALESGESIAGDFDDVCQYFVWNNQSARWLNHPDWTVRLYEASLQETREIARQVKDRLRHLSLPILSIEDTLPRTTWEQSSIDGITFTLGFDGNEKVEVTLGSNILQLHNAIITGAIGQGKSNLIKSVVYDLCTRYSPDELELYLLDFKEGVTLYQMAPTEGSPEYLPQARVLGLEADEDFGISVLEELFRIGAKRAQTIKPYGDNIFKYRSACPDAIMPRILLVIDEFQIFLDSERGSYAAELLVRAARTLRSYGIHIILASQSISGISALLAKSDTFYAQFPIRIGLKNSPNESRATFGPLNDAAAHLRFRGQAVLNENYGEVKANRIVHTPNATDTAINRVRDRLFHLRKDIGKSVVVFDGTSMPKFRGVKTQDMVIESGRAPSILLGRTITVSQGLVRFVLDQMPGRNIVVVGNGIDASNPDSPNLGLALIVSAIRSLALGGGASSDDFIILDCLASDDIFDEAMKTLCEEISPNVGSITVLDAKDSRVWISDFLASEHVHSDERKRYVFGVGMDRLGTFDMSIQNQLCKRIKDAPIKNMYFMLWWVSPGALNSQLGMAATNAFDGVALMFGTDSLAKQIEGPMSTWNGRNLRVLYKDSTSGRPAERIIPFQIEQ